jgi:hypothetical protein
MAGVGADGADLLVTAGDYLRLWRVSPNSAYTRIYIYIYIYMYIYMRIHTSICIYA